MQAGLEPGDRKILIVAGVVVLVAAFTTAFLIPPSARFAPPFASSYSAASGGAKAAYLLLEKMGFHVERWTAPPADLPHPEGRRSMVLILASPVILPSAEDGAAIQSFAAAGGVVIATGWMGAQILGVQAKTVGGKYARTESYGAEVPSPLTFGAPELSMMSSARFPALGPAVERVYGDKAGATVVAYRVGRGEVVWWASASPLTNYGLTQASNLVFFLNSVELVTTGASAFARERQPARPQWGRSRTLSPMLAGVFARAQRFHGLNAAALPAAPLILWDEYFHGDRKTLWGYLGATPMPWAGLQIALLLAAALFTFGRRAGPLRSVEASGDRLSPMEFVDALGNLYRRKGSASGAVQFAYQHFQFEVESHARARSAGGKGEELLGAVRTFRDRIPFGLQETLLECERAVEAGGLPERDALRLIQRLHDGAAELGLAEGDYGARSI